MKEEKGITLVILVITVILMAILIGATVQYGVNSLNATKFQNFSYELQQIQGKIDIIYEKIKLGEEKYITYGKNITDPGAEKARNTLEIVRNMNYSNVIESERERYYYQYPSITYYRYLTAADLKRYLDISSDPGDVIINFKTRDVISVDGFEHEGVTYYTLSQIKK